jgi:putative membrane protein
MLSLAHGGQPLGPHDLWAAWDLSPPVVLALIAAAWVYVRGRRATNRRSDGEVWRARCFAGALLAIGMALVSPLSALSDALASAHMVQHVLLMLVAAPLLALSAPSATLLRGTPGVLRRASGPWRGRLGQMWRGLPVVRNAATLWLLHTGTLWFWHAALPYEAALSHEIVHVTEHVSFLVTALLVWRIVVGVRATERVPQGLGAMLVFAMALQSGFLSLLLPFARTPWYSAYAATTRAWGLEPLADQQLAGLIMWIPAGFVYLGVALALFVSWVRSSELEDVPGRQVEISETNSVEVSRKC